MANNIIPNVSSGDLVGSTPTFPPNAVVRGDFLYLRDVDGNQIPGRTVSDGDEITVLFISNEKNIVLVQYPTSSGYRQGYVTNATSIIKYKDDYSWVNGSTPEPVYDFDKTTQIGTLDPRAGRSVSVGDKITVLDVSYSKQLALVQYPAGNVVRQGYVTNATNLIRYFNQSMWHKPLYKKNGMTHVVYNTSKGPNTKSGYVKYEGSAATRVDIPRPSITNAQKIVYGTSGRGRELAAYKVGNGANSLIYVCAIHGWEDHWAADGIELTRIGNGLIEHFQNAGTNNWSLYIIPVANPDGLSEGYTNNGPGRCTIVGAVDCNRDFPIGFTPYGDSRHWTNKEPLSVPESRSLRDFISEIKGKTSGSTYLIDMHGWEDKTIGDSHISRAFQNQFGFVNGNYDGVYQAGFLISWANSIGVRAALIELPQSCYSHSDAVNGRYLQKSINAVTNLIGGSGGSSSGGSTGGSSGSDSTGGSSSSDVRYRADGKVIGVQTFLNVRKGPGISYDSIGQLHQGDNVRIIAKNGEWYKIKYDFGYGYVHSDFIKINNNINNRVCIFKSERFKLLDSEGNLANDLKANDFDESQILAINGLFKNEINRKEEYLFDDLRRMGKALFSIGELEDVFLDMVDHFKNANGIDYKNEILNKHIREHKSTKEYVNKIKELAIEELKINKGDLSKIEFDKNGKLYQKIQQNVKFPDYSSLFDIIEGLTITVHDTWANKVEIRDYSINGNKFTGKLHYVIYDHFGLDKPDVEKKYVYLSGFRAWFTLQHFKKFKGLYKPFVTVMEIDVPFTGEIL
ncbi:DUF3289 family protein (plasmid) [Clostridium perfringens]